MNERPIDRFSSHYLYIISDVLKKQNIKCLTYTM